MKKKSLLLMLLMALIAPWAANAQSLCDPSEQCEISYTLTDAYGDGWDSGATLAVIDVATSTTLATWHLSSGSSSSGTLAVCNGREINFVWTNATGSYVYNYECGYTVLDPSGNEIVSLVPSGYDNPDEGIVATYIVNCPSCPVPTDLTATLTPGDGTIATLNWTAGGEETAWVLEYGTTSDFTGATSVNVSGTPSKDLIGLTAETKYYARVKADCGGGDTSDWSATCEFTPTDQLIISVLGTTGSTYSYLPSHTNYDYAYTQQIYTATEMGGFPCALTSVAFKGNKAAVCDLDIYLANTTKSSFTGTSDYIAISEATLVFSGEVTFIANDWKTIAFDNDFDYEGGNLAVIVDDNSNNYDYGSTTWQTFNTTTAQAMYFYQDDTNINPSSPSATYSGIPSIKNQIKFVYELPSPYVKPQNLAVTNLTGTTATITWEAPNSDVLSYKYQYRQEGGTWNALTSTTALSAPLTSLTGNTTYEFQVQAIYAGNNESGFASKTFTTLIAIPYEYGFEDATEFGKWETVDCEYDDYNYLSGVVTYAAYAHSGNNFFSFSSYNGATDPQYLISPALSGIANGLHVSFYYRSANNNDPETFMVGYSTTDTDPDSFTWSDEVTSPDNNYYPYAVNFMVPEIKYVAIKYTTANMYYLFVDDFTFEEAPDCLEPTNVIVSNITTTSADITWTNGGSETSWDIFATDDSTIVPDGTTTPTVEGVTTKPHQLTLQPGTTYYVYVRAACSSTETSAWSSPAVFHTDCEGMDLPYGPYGFEDGALTVCWNILSTNTAYNTVSINNNTSYVHAGDYSLLMHSGSADGDFVVALPVIDDSYSLSDYRFVFWAMASNTDLKATIGIMEDPNDMTTFVAQSEEFNPASEYTEYKIPFSGYTGDGYYVAIKVSRASGSSHGNVYFDDIAIELTPSCIEPSGLTVSNETAHGATFGWTSNGSETEWHLYFGKDNTAPADDIDLSKVTVANSNPFTMTTGLDPETDYYVWVRANCGSTDGYSAWVGPETFTTAPSCFVPTGLAVSEITNHSAKFSWTGTSDSYIVKIGEVVTTPFKSYDFEDNAISTDFTNSTTYPWTATAGGYNSSSYCATPGNKGVNSSTSDLTLALTLTENATISFYAKVSSESGCDYGRFLIDGTQKVNISGTTSTWTKYEYDLTVGTHTLIWRYYKDVSMASGDDLFYVDDIIITKKSVASWITYNTASSPFTVNDPVNIHPETNYAVKVQGNCGSEGLSQESAPVFFTTDIPCPAPTGLTASNPKSSSFDLQWTNGGSEDWIVAYKKTTDADFSEINLNESDVTVEGNLITYTLGGLEAETDYIVKVQDNCEASYTGDGVSEWTAEVPYSTIAACSAMNPVVSDITHHNATVTWEGESADNFTVKYRTAALVSNESPVFSEQFNTSSSTPPTGWTRFRGLVDKVIDGTATLTTTTSGWYCDNTNALATLNIYGTSVNYWLVTPEVTLTTGLALSFDMALTDYGNANALDNPTAQLDDRFVVLAYADDAWHILREWNNSGSAYVYNNIATTGEKAVIDLSAYNGKTVKIAFYGESTAAGGDNDFHIDNVLIGTPTAAGDWNDIPANTTTAEITHLTAGTLYDVKVVTGCTPSMETEIISINTVSSTTKHFLAEGNWNDGTKWMDAEFPTTDDIAILHANVTIPADAKAYVNNILIGGTPEPTITIKDGGELYHTTTVNRVTMEKEIVGATTWGLNQGASDGWYVISNPLSHTSLTPTTTTYVTNLAPAAVASVPQFDLYKYSESNMNWYSYNAHPSSYYLERGVGFLYARNGDATISFNTTTSYYLPVADVTPSLTFTAANDDMAGWNLLGNPFSHSITWANIEATNVNTTGYYKLGNDGQWTADPSTTTAIKPMEGFLVKATAASPTITIKNVAASSKGRANDDFLAFTIANSNYSDITYAMFSDGEGLEKINHRNTNVPMVYIPQDGERYAIATMGDETDMFNLNFKAMTTGKYTLSYKAEGSYDYLHVIDRITGEDVDMLIDGEYSFMASAGDNENRFIVKLRYNANGNFENDIFAYQNGDEIIVNGEGELQIFDVMGRFVTSMEVNGSERISAEQYSNAVYIFRLVGNDVKTQKIVVR